MNAPQGPSVLVVDDDAATRRLYVAALGRAGYQVVTAANGLQALEVLTDVPVACVLLDSRMPGMSGPELVAKLRGQPEFALLPIIMVTGSGEVEDRVAGLDLGADDYLLKPVDLNELLARVRAHLRVSTSWADAARDNLQQRLQAVTALSRIRISDDPHVAAAAVVEQLGAFEGIDSALIYGFTGSDGAVLLAGHARHDDSDLGDLPVGVTRRLRELASKGPHLLDAGLETRWWGGGPSKQFVISPYGPPGEPSGVLVLNHSRPAAGDFANVSFAIDIANVVQGLLGPLLLSLAERSASAEEIRLALGAEGSRIVFQPVVDVRDLQVVGFEALARFGDGRRPDQRLKDARRSGILPEIELALVTAAFESAATLASSAWLSVNLSPAVLVSGDGLAAEVGKVGRPVVIEITENEPIDDYPAVRSAFARMPPSTRLSIDDAGAGFASLRHVFELAPAFVKLDREWVADIDRDPVRQALVEALVSFTRRGDSLLIAEGVETEAELDALARLGITLAQGYLLGRPEDPPGDPLDLVGRRRPSISR